jgi:hypothetical protein
MPGAYFSLNGVVASTAFCRFEKVSVPKTAGAAKIAAPVAVAFFKKSLLECSIYSTLRNNYYFVAGSGT